MKLKTAIILLFCIISVSGEAIPTIGLIHPTKKQLKNIEILFEKDYLALSRLNVLCIYHENENENYAESLQYIKENNLNYFDFYVIKGAVTLEQVYQKNLWTEQFYEIFRRIDGIIFTGGEDLPPELYRAETHLLTEPRTPQRSYYEISLLFHLLKGNPEAGWKPFLDEKRNFPVLAICLGAQSMNVALGGTLYQDIPTEIYNLFTIEKIINLPKDQIHSSVYYEKKFSKINNLVPHFHRIKINANSKIIGTFLARNGDQPLVLSSHHQALNKLAPDLYITATSIDGKIVEAVEHKIYPNVLGLQFHPEPYILFLKGIYFNSAEGRKINLKAEVIDRQPNQFFYKRLWNWFAEKVQQNH